MNVRNITGTGRLARRASGWSICAALLLAGCITPAPDVQPVAAAAVTAQAAVRNEPPAELPELSAGTASLVISPVEQQQLQALLADATLAQQVRLLLLLQQPAAALRALQNWRLAEQQLRANANPFALLPYELLAKATLAGTKTQAEQAKSSAPLVIALNRQRFAQIFTMRMSALSDVAAHQASSFWLRDPAENLAQLQQLQRQLRASASDASSLAALQRDYWVAYADYYLLSQAWQVAIPLLAADRQRRYQIEMDVQIPAQDDVLLSAIVVRSKSRSAPAPVVLSASIYANDAVYLQHAIAAAARGYVGVVSFSRGKRSSNAMITPYENEAADVSAVINWLSRQRWSDGRVAMYGGSYLGYTQWAAIRQLPAALKTIVPAAAAMPGQGLPMENNIFLNANYAWPFFVGNSRYDDPKAYSQHNDREVNQRWFQSGRPYREFDQLAGQQIAGQQGAGQQSAGQPNRWFQKWLQHPAYDSYWQAMVPTAAHYQKLHIPVLSLTGYYDDGQISALQYLQAHYASNTAAKHYLVIGPYDHLTAQHGSRDVLLRGYPLDKVAHVSPLDLTFSWFDYVLKGKAKPALLQDFINYQLMDDNSWRHAPSLAALQQQAQRFYFAPKPAVTAPSDASQPAASQAVDLLLTAQAPAVRQPAALATQQVDLRDRRQSYNDHYYPWPLLQAPFLPANGLVLQTAPFAEPMIYAGTFKASVRLRLNKQDVDLGFTLFEVRPDGQYFHLGYLLGRASYASDASKRQLLTPNAVNTVYLQHSRFHAKKIGKGSRLLLLANINVNPYAQINYGTGGDVSTESVQDAAIPLTLEWLSGSFVELPIRRWTAAPAG